MRLLRRERTATAEPPAQEAPGDYAQGTATAGEPMPAEARGPRIGARERLGARERADGLRREEAAGALAAEPAARRRGMRWRTREAGAATVGAVGSGILALARLVMLVAGLIALLIAVAIVLRDVDANATNSIVKGIHEGANFFAGAFTGLISFSGHHPKRSITVNWGIALVVYLLVGAAIASFIARIGYGGLRFERRHRAAVTH